MQKIVIVGGGAGALAKLGIKVCEQTMVANADEQGFTTKTNERIDADSTTACSVCSPNGGCGSD